jgi:predicted PurR-regulated permease PerM
MKEEARLLETSVAKSFGGFLRGQAILGLVYGVIVAGTSAILALPYLGITSAVAGVLMAIPFFGPFVAWAPPVIVAILAKPDAVVPTILLVGVGWLLVMNILQPRLMQEAVGIHPIVVLGSVLIGSKVAGVTGAIFGIPIAAVLSAFFLHYLAITREPSPVTERAAKRVEQREGRKVRIPSEPVPGIDPDVTA